jgi:dTDP-4-dehydrorhamnose reductase
MEAADASLYAAAGATRREVDITDPDAVREAVRTHKAALVVNAAAYTAVDRAESEPAQAYGINRDGARNVAAACAETGTMLIHLSTDYVFDGSKAGSYRESDEPAPAGVYGRSKLEGEEAIRALLPEGHLIVRTAWVFSARGHNFLRTIWRLARERDEVRVVDDQIGCPTPADALASDILRMGDVLLTGECEPGTYHWAGQPAVTWYGFASAIVEAARGHGAATARVMPIATADYPTPAPRPANSVLDTSKAQAAFGLTPPSWQDGLVRAAALLAVEG